MAVGLSIWLEMSNEEQAAHLRQEEAEHVRRLRSLTEEQSIRMFFQLRDMGRYFPQSPHPLPLAPSLIIG